MAKSLLRYQEAMWRGERVVESMGITRLPIDPFGIAKKHNIEVCAKSSDKSGVSGFLMKVGDSFGIKYAIDIDNEGRKRFTVAHELGHYFLPGHAEYLFGNTNTIHASRSGFITRDEHELEADYFASGMLMPSNLLRHELNEAGEGFSAIEHLANRCLVSLTAAAIRYAQCSEDPVAVIVSEGERVAYCVMSDAIRNIKGIEWISKGTAIARSTETFKFNQSRDNIRYCRQAEAWTTLDLWFDGVPAVEMKEDVVGLGGYGKSLTVLYTNDSIADDEEEDDENDY